MKKINPLAKNNYLKLYLSSIKTKVAIKFPKKSFFFFFFFLPKIGLTLKGLKERFSFHK